MTNPTSQRRNADPGTQEGGTVGAGWGNSWQTDYPDAEVSARLSRAVEHLQRALSGARLGYVGPEEMAKRAADVANQAFMLADPERLRRHQPERVP